MYKMWSSFDNNYEVRVAFRDISKAFDTVCHEGIANKLKQEISGNSVKLQINLLKNRWRRVVLTGQCSHSANVNAGVSIA